MPPARRLSWLSAPSKMEPNTVGETPDQSNSWQPWMMSSVRSVSSMVGTWTFSANRPPFM